MSDSVFWMWLQSNEWLWMVAGCGSWVIQGFWWVSGCTGSRVEVIFMWMCVVDEGMWMDAGFVWKMVGDETG